MCIIVLLGLTVIAAIGGWYLAAFLGGWVAEAGWAPVIAAMVLAPLLSVLVHEAGHLAGGVAAGMRPVLLIAGPFVLRWRHRRFWPRLRLSPLVAGGFTLCVPGPGGTVRKPMLAMVSGGPVASFILIASGAAIGRGGDGIWQGAAAFTAFLSAGIFVFTAVPWTRMGMASDGAKIRMLSENGRRARALTANLALLAAAWRGLPPAQWPRAGLEAVLAAEPGSPERVAGLHLAYWAALDKGDHDEAGRLVARLQESAAGMSEPIAAPAAFEAAAFHLFVRRQPETARALIEGRKLPVFSDGYLAFLIQAGLALAAGRRGNAAACARRARAQLSRALFPAVAALHARWLDDIEATLAGTGDDRAR